MRLSGSLGASAQAAGFVLHGVCAVDQANRLARAKRSGVHLLGTGRNGRAPGAKRAGVANVARTKRVGRRLTGIRQVKQHGTTRHAVVCRPELATAPARVVNRPRRRNLLCRGVILDGRVQPRRVLGGKLLLRNLLVRNKAVARHGASRIRVGRHLRVGLFRNVLHHAGVVFGLCDSVAASVLRLVRTVCGLGHRPVIYLVRGPEGLLRRRLGYLFLNRLRGQSILLGSIIRQGRLLGRDVARVLHVGRHGLNAIGVLVPQSRGAQRLQVSRCLKLVERRGIVHGLIRGFLLRYRLLVRRRSHVRQLRVIRLGIVNHLVVLYYRSVIPKGIDSKGSCGCIRHVRIRFGFGLIVWLGLICCCRLSFECGFALRFRLLLRRRIICLDSRDNLVVMVVVCVIVSRRVNAVVIVVIRRVLLGMRLLCPIVSRFLRDGLMPLRRVNVGSVFARLTVSIVFQMKHRHVRRRVNRQRLLASRRKPCTLLTVAMPGKQRLQLRKEAGCLSLLFRLSGSDVNQLVRCPIIRRTIDGRVGRRSARSFLGQSAFVLLDIIAFDSRCVIVVRLGIAVVHGDEKLVVLCSYPLGIHRVILRRILDQVILVLRRIGHVPFLFRCKVRVRRGCLFLRLRRLCTFRLCSGRRLDRGFGLARHGRRGLGL